MFHQLLELSVKALTILWLRPCRVIIVGASLVLGGSQPTRGQSALDALEKLVQQLNQNQADSEKQPNAPSGRTEELPLPQDGQQKLPTPSSAPARGPIYLGLEAEEVVGGGIGVRVTGVTRNSPAWKSGIAVDDRIIAVDGFAIDGLDAFANRLTIKSPGDECRFIVTRRGKNIDLVAVLMDANLAGEIQSRPLQPEQAGPVWVGIQASDLSASFRQQFGLQIFDGAAVTNVERQSPAQVAGLRAGDCIVEAAAQPIRSADDLRRIIESARPGEKIDLLVYRGVARKNLSLVVRTYPVPTTPRPPSQTQANTSTTPLLPSTPVPNDVQPGSAATTLLDALPIPQLLPSLPDSGEPSRNDLPQALQEAGGSSDQRVAELEAEVAELRRQLESANQRLEETQAQLRSILNSLQINR